MVTGADLFAGKWKQWGAGVGSDVIGELEKLQSVEDLSRFFLTQGEAINLRFVQLLPSSSLTPSGLSLRVTTLSDATHLPNASANKCKAVLRVRPHRVA